MHKSKVMKDVFVFVLALLLGACENGKSPAPEPDPPFLGTWRLYSHKQDGWINVLKAGPPVSVLATNIHRDTVFAGDKYFLEIKGDETFSSFLPGTGVSGKSAQDDMSASGTWSFEGNRLVSIFPDNQGGTDTLRSDIAVLQDGMLYTFNYVLRVIPEGVDTTIVDLTTRASYSK